MSFRQSYKLVSKTAIRWFPGHMFKGLRQMQQKLKSVDCIIEVHDARVPFSGRNPELHQSIAATGVKPYILVLNKRDMIDVREQKSIISDLRRKEDIENIIFTNCKDHKCKGTKKILPLAKKLILSSERYNRSSEKDCCLMIMGVPNVGKSSLLNVLRNTHMKKKAVAEVGAIAGVTRSVMEKIKISEDPLVYMIDTPGILEPSIKDDETGMKLALVGCLPDHLVGEDLIADYLLYWLNKHKRYEYVELMSLKEPTDNIEKLLCDYANHLGVRKTIKKYDGQLEVMPDRMLAAQRFIRLFRKGTLGPMNLDIDF